MSQNKRHDKAQKELEETQILVDYLTTHGLDFDDISNFSEKTVRTAKEWFNATY